MCLPTAVLALFVEHHSVVVPVADAVHGQLIMQVMQLTGDVSVATKSSSVLGGSPLTWATD
jgi:hypothetical protein